MAFSESAHYDEQGRILSAGDCTYGTTPRAFCDPPMRDAGYMVSADGTRVYAVCN